MKCNRKTINTLAPAIMSFTANCCEHTHSAHVRDGAILSFASSKNNRLASGELCLVLQTQTKTTRDFLRLATYPRREYQPMSCSLYSVCVSVHSLMASNHKCLKHVKTKANNVINPKLKNNDLLGKRLCVLMTPCALSSHNSWPIISLLFLKEKFRLVTTRNKHTQTLLAS